MATIRALKDVAIKVARQHVQKLMDQGEFNALCKEMGEITVDILKMSLDTKLPQSPWHNSNNCVLHSSSISYSYVCGTFKGRFNYYYGEFD